MAEHPTVLPYAGTSGWSGSEASRERAETEDADGTTSIRQTTVLKILGDRGRLGCTWKELSAVTGWHHGQATGVLSVLHKTGRLCRLTEKRGRCSVYVLPEHVQEREVAAHGRRARPDGSCSDPAHADLQREVEVLRRRIARITELVRPKVRVYSYTREHLLEDIRRALL